MAAAKKPSNIEKDANKQEVARFVVEASLNSEIRDIPDQVMALTSEKAVANQFFFVLLGSDKDGVAISILPKLLWDAQKKEETGSYEREGLVNFAMPQQGDNIMEMTWTFGDDKGVEQTAKILNEAGFQFSKDLQNSRDGSLTATIEKALKNNASAAFGKAKIPKKEKTPQKPASRAKPGRIGGCMGNGGITGRGKFRS